MSTRLSELTTLRLGGPVPALTTATDEAQIVEAVRAADDLLIVGGGSNLVAADEGWSGAALAIRSRGVDVRRDGDDVLVRVAAGEPWDGFVERAVAEGWSGLETLSGIPGLTGATPVQNVGAYGAEVADVITSLRVLDRASGEVQAWAPAQAGFGFRTSAFKHTDRFVVLEVTFRLAVRATSVPLRYLELARRLGVEPGATTTLPAVRDAVLTLRRSKGMVLDAADHDTWSVGSFFVNPHVDVVPTAAAECPQWDSSGRIKLSAAWLIERAGFPRGYTGSAGGRVSVSTKHTLALTNRGGATTVELLALAREIRDGVERRFGIRLGPEAHLAPNVAALW